VSDALPYKKDFSFDSLLPGLLEEHASESNPPTHKYDFGIDSLLPGLLEEHASAPTAPLFGKYYGLDDLLISLLKEHASAANATCVGLMPPFVKKTMPLEVHNIMHIGADQHSDPVTHFYSGQLLRTALLWLDSIKSLVLAYCQKMHATVVQCISNFNAMMELERLDFFM
jgi:hypothetical protein